MGHHHGKKKDLDFSSGTKRQRKALQVLESLRSLDGFDEFATLIGQLFPGIGQHIATLSILAPALPFVWLGLLGMKGEYREAVGEYKKILHSNNDSITKLTKLASFSRHYCDIINRRCGLELSFPSYKPRKHEKASIDDISLEIFHFQELQTDKLLRGIERKYGWTGLVGMGGMFTGMLASVSDACAEIAAAASPSIEVSASASAAVLSAVAGGLFLVGQVAMSGYAANKVRVGKKQIKRLKSQQSILHNNSTLDPQYSDHINDILLREISYIKKHSVKYGAATIVGQAFMASGVIMGLSGVGLMASLPLFAIGAPATIIPAIYRIVAEQKESRFKGELDHDLVVSYLNNFNPVQLINTSKEDPEPYHTARNKVVDAFDITIEKLVIVKTLSLLHRVASSRKTRALNPEEKFNYILNRFKNNRIKRSQLEYAVVERILTFLHTSKDDLIKLFENNHDDLYRILSSAAKYTLDKEEPENIADAVVKYCVDVDPEDLAQLHKKQSKNNINIIKDILKARRFGLAHTVIQLNAIEEISKNITQEYTASHSPKSQTPHAPMEHREHSLSLAQDHQPKAEENTPAGALNFDHALKRLKIRINQLYANNTNPASDISINKDLEEINHIRFLAKTEQREYILRHPVEHVGTRRIYTWRRPSPSCNHDTSGDIWYIQDTLTGKIEVKCPHCASFIILSDPSHHFQHGGRVLTTQNGNTTSVGHLRNQRYDMPKLAKYTQKTQNHKDDHFMMP